MNWFFLQCSNKTIAVVRHISYPYYLGFTIGMIKQNNAFKEIPFKHVVRLFEWNTKLYVLVSTVFITIRRVFKWCILGYTRRIPISFGQCGWNCMFYTYLSKQFNTVSSNLILHCILFYDIRYRLFIALCTIQTCLNMCYTFKKCQSNQAFFFLVPRGPPMTSEDLWDHLNVGAVVFKRSMALSNFGAIDSWNEWSTRFLHTTLEIDEIGHVSTKPVQEFYTALLNVDIDEELWVVVFWGLLCCVHQAAVVSVPNCRCTWADAYRVSLLDTVRARVLP